MDSIKACNPSQCNLRGGGDLSKEKILEVMSKQEVIRQLKSFRNDCSYFESVEATDKDVAALEFAIKILKDPSYEINSKIIFQNKKIIGYLINIFISMVTTIIILVLSK